VSPRSFGIEGITDEDRAYGGSRFAEVREALFANPYLYMAAQIVTAEAVCEPDHTPPHVGGVAPIATA